MADVKWIKITTNIFDDEKIKIIESMPDGDAIIVIWFKLLTLCGRINAGGGALVMKGTNIPYTEEMLATLLNRDIINVKYALQTFERFGMIEIEDNSIVISNWEKHQNIEGLERISKTNAERQKRYRERKNQKLLDVNIQEKDEHLKSNVTRNVTHNVTRNVTHNVTVTPALCNSNAIDIDIDKDKEYIKDIVQIPSSNDEVAQSNKKSANQELLEAQERIWSEYPVKRGKQSAMNAIKKLYKTHTDVLIIKAIQMYKDDVETQRKAGFKDLRYMNGDTFFRSRIHDYLGKDGVNGVNKLGEENSESKNKKSKYSHLYRNK